MWPGWDIRTDGCGDECARVIAVCHVTLCGIQVRMGDVDFNRLDLAASS